LGVSNAVFHQIPSLKEPYQSSAKQPQAALAAKGGA